MTTVLCAIFKIGKFEIKIKSVKILYRKIYNIIMLQRGLSAKANQFDLVVLLNVGKQKLYCFVWLSECLVKVRFIHGQCDHLKTNPTSQTSLNIS